MAGTRPQHENRLLAALREDAYRRVAPKLRRRTLHPRQVLYKANQAIGEVYFPETAVICLLAMMKDGDTIETATVGHEGASWISASVNAPSMPCETIVAIGGEASVLSVADLDEEMQQNEHFRDVLTKYSHALLIHSLRMTGCSGLHALPQRCARWVLEAADRVHEDRFAVTHEFLAMLLGATRPSVSVVIEDFRQRGLLRTSRGQLVVGNREQLLQTACECYDVIKQNYQKMGR